MAQKKLQVQISRYQEIKKKTLHVHPSWSILGCIEGTRDTPAPPF